MAVKVKFDNRKFYKFLEGLDDLSEDVCQSRVNTKLEELVKDNKVAIVINHWKAITQQFKDVAVILNKVEGGFVYHYDSFHDFPSRSSGNDLVTVVADKVLDDEHAEAIADLVYNFGAEAEGLLSW